MWSQSDEKKEEKAYSYDEALELAGSGWYNIQLLLISSLSLLAMCIDMFSLSVVVTLSSCDIPLDVTQKSILMSTPFLGPVATAYAWGYISDTGGRKRSLLIAMSVSFVMSISCAFAPNWIVLAILRLIGTCFCSCAQSATYTLLGESCPEKIKGSYLLIMSSVVHVTAPIYLALAYYIGNLDFAYDLGSITFVPWRLLIIVLALPLGMSAVSLVFFYESPKFLLNAGHEDEALEVLKGISRRNGVEVEKYLVQKLILNEDGNLRRKDLPLLESLWEQTAPLFKTPLLLRTLLLYYLILVIYSSNSTLYLWMPFLTNAFTSKTDLSFGNQSYGLCYMISDNISVTSNYSIIENVEKPCTSNIDSYLVIATLITGFVYATLNMLMAKLASRKKVLITIILSLSTISCLMTTMIPNKNSTIFYLGVLSTSLCMGPLSSYYVDLFPTSFRGMAACLGVMVARISSVIGVNLIGPFITSHCTNTFYSLTALLSSGVIMSFLLPADRPKNIE